MKRTTVYVHFPWCTRKCPYCDFATKAAQSSAIPGRDYADALKREVNLRADRCADRKLHAIFLGGGTPSLWEPALVGEVLREIRNVFDAESDNLEITIECNPASLTPQKITQLCEVGVTRVSIGVQSLRDQHLKFLGRLHNAEQAQRAIDAAVAIAPRASADLIFGMPGQNEASFIEDIQRLIDAGLRHVSAYSLTIEPNTTFGALHRAGKLRVCNEDEYVALFEAAHRTFTDAGLMHYEVSNYAAPGETSTHNQHYWRGGAYLGLGAAAVGCLELEVGRARRWRNDPEPAAYLAATDIATLESESEELHARELAREALMLGLRTQEGVDLAAVEARIGQDLRVGREESIAACLGRGDLELDTNVLRVPATRWLKLDGIVRELF